MAEAVFYAVVSKALVPKDRSRPINQTESVLSIEHLFVIDCGLHTGLQWTSSLGAKGETLTEPRKGKKKEVDRPPVPGPSGFTGLTSE